MQIRTQLLKVKKKKKKKNVETQKVEKYFFLVKIIIP